MGLVVTLFVALAVTTVGYAAFGQGGGVAGLVFFAILLVGATLRVFKPSSLVLPIGASLRPRSLACRARHAPCVLGLLDRKAPGPAMLNLCGSACLPAGGTVQALSL